MSREQEIAKRRKAAQETEFEVSILDVEFGDLPTISARVDSPTGRSYEVRIRSIDRQFNYCECPDFSTNALGTCKHLEAVLQRLADPSAAELVSELQPRTALVFLDAASCPPRVRLHDPDESAPDAVRNLFSSKGFLLAKARLRALELLAHAPEGIVVAPEALAWLRGLQVREQVLEAAAKVGKELARHPSLANAPGHVAEAVRFLVEKGRAILADDVLADRPNEAATALAVLAQEGLVHKCVVACPETRKSHWQQLLIRKTGRKVSLMAGRSLASSTDTYSRYPFLVVAHQDLPLAEEKLRHYAPDALIVDEGHRIRRWEGPAAGVLKRLQAKFVFLLADRSLLEEPRRLYFAFQLLDPYALGPYWRFSERHLIRDSRGRITATKSWDAVDALVSSRILARKRDSLGRGPFKLRLIVDMAAVQRRLMLQPAAGLLAKLKEGPNHWSHMDRAEVVAYVARLRKLADHCGTNLPPERSPKVVELLEFLRQFRRWAPQHVPVLVSTRFRDAATRLGEHLGERGVTTLVLATKRDLAHLPEEWPEDGPEVAILCDDLLGAVPRRAYAAHIHLDVPWSPVTVKARRLAVKTPVGAPVVELELILADSVEPSVRKALVTKGAELARIVSNPASELEALPSTDPAGVDAVVQTTIEEHVIRALVPSHLPLPKGMSSAAIAARKSSSAPKAVAVRVAGGQRRGTTSSPGLGDVVVISLASLRFDDLDKLKFGLAVTYSFRQDAFTGWKREYVGHLVRQLSSASLVVGWSPASEDFPVLSSYTSINLHKIPTLGLVDEVQKQVGLRIPQDLLAEATLAKRRPINEQRVDELWRDRRIEELAQALYEDVKLLRDLFVVAVTQGSLFYPAGPSGRATEVSLPLREMLPEAVLTLVERAYAATKRSV